MSISLANKMENSKEIQKLHKPVLVKQVFDALNAGKYAHLKNRVCFVDATVGLGGHAQEFVKNNIFVIGIDADPNTLEIAEDVLNKACPAKYRTVLGCFKLLHGNFSDMDTLVRSVYSEPVKGILFDLGISSLQLDNPERGFSFKDYRFPLDMRLDRESQNVKASDLLAVLDKTKLTDMFAEVMPAGLAYTIAKAVVAARTEKPFLKTGDFLETVKPLIRKKGKIDNATLPFLALRMAVNSELDNLKLGLEKAFNILAKGGRLAVISFHSGEDRIVKSFFRKMENGNYARLIAKKPVTPDLDEIQDNPRSRSAKMRVLEKI